MLPTPTLLYTDFRIRIILQCSPSVRQSRTNVGGREVTRATDFFFILWNINLGSLKSYVYYTHSSYSHSFPAAFPILLQLSKALTIVHCNTKRFPPQLSAHIFCYSCPSASSHRIHYFWAHFYSATESKS